MTITTLWAERFVNVLPVPTRMPNHPRGTQDPLDLDELHWIQVRGILISETRVRETLQDPTRDVPAGVVYAAMVDGTALLNLVINAILSDHCAQRDNAIWMLEQAVRYGTRETVISATLVLTIIVEMEYA